MYYMQPRNFPKPQWTPLALLGLLRASLLPGDRARASAALHEEGPPPEPLDSEQLSEVANAWRTRTSFGDLGAESVAQALELVANHRAAEKRKRGQALGDRLTDLTKL
jgi:hypothetical protein